MQDNSSKKQIALLYVLSLILPIIMMIVISVILGMYPFGERTILVADMSKQFNDYFAYFKTIVTGENNLIYTFSKNLGGDMVGFSAYYLQNPFLFILLLFPNHILPLGIWIMIILQVACSSFTFCVYLNKTNIPSRMSLLFSLAYAFMGYVFAYITLPIYFCNIILLPLVMLGIHNLLNNTRKWWLYTLTLALSILSNYYIGYMVCLFSALFFVYLLISRTEQLKKVKEYGKQIVTFITASLLGVLLTAFDLIPTVFSLQGQKSVPSGATLSFYRNFHMINAFSKLYTNMYDGNTSNDNLPFIYVGFVTVVFLLFYFLNQNIKIREKIITLLFMGIILMCFYLHTIDVIWHGFNDPVGFPYRNAFCFSFLLLMIAYRGLITIGTQQRMKEYYIVAAIFISYSIYLFFTNRSAIVFRSIVFDSVLLILIILIAYIASHRQWSQNIWFLLILAVQVVDLSSNAISSVKQYTDYVPMQEYSEYISQTTPLIEYVKERDTSLYRMEKNFQRTHNDSMQFNYRGLSHSSSCEKDYVKTFMEKMGFRNFGLWAYYDEGGTAFADCLLGVKYYISQFDATGKPYDLIHQENEKYIFQNTHALPFAFGVNQTIASVDMNEKNSFVIQNEIANRINGQNDAIFTEVQQNSLQFENLQESNVEEYTTYTKEVQNEEAFIDYQLKITSHNPVYLFFEAPGPQAAEITVNDFWFGNYFTDTKWDIVEIGSFNEGDIVSVKLYAKGDTLTLGNAYFYYEDNDALIKMSDHALLEAAELKKVSDSHLQGTVEIKNSDNLLFTIPYEPDWKIYIDGVHTEQQRVLSALMAVPITEGIHTIKMIYVPRGIEIGLILSLLSLILCVILILLQKKNTGKLQESDNKQLSEEPPELKLI